MPKKSAAANPAPASLPAKEAGHSPIIIASLLFVCGLSWAIISLVDHSAK